MLDRRDRPRAATRGVYLATEGSVYPKAWDVEETFAGIGKDASQLVTVVEGAALGTVR